MIPSIIHQIWLGSNIDPKVIPFMNIAKTMSNEYKLWADENVWTEVGKTKEEFAQYWNLDPLNIVSLVDVLKILLLKKIGGWYADCDVEIFKNVDNYQNNLFVTNIDYIPFKETNIKPKKVINIFGGFIHNEFFGSIPEHPFLSLLINEMESKKKLDIHWTRIVGGDLFWEIINKYKGNDITYLNKEKSDSFLKHHFFNSWVEKWGDK